MRKIIWLPLEPLKQRYTADWYEWFPREFKKLGIEFITVDGKCLTDKIEKGSVLDIYGTNFWKFSQMAQLIQLMRSGEVTSLDTLFFADLWYPGLEALRYIKDQTGYGPKIAGVLHAGTWDPNDFTVRSGMTKWARKIEESWFQIYDYIFVATLYHKKLILKSIECDPNKIWVTGLPFYPKIKESPVKKYDIVFPHRLDEEKSPGEFDSLVANFGCRSIKTAEKYMHDKDGYYSVLSQSLIAVSTARQETFGYSMLEATAAGCIPFVPDNLSYKEMYFDIFRYKNLLELKETLKIVLSSDLVVGLRDKVKEQAEDHKMKYSQSINNMVKIMLEN